jgi:sugar (pentulose or hexulose) kinase
MDFGTSSIKISIVDENCNILKSAKASYEIRIYNGDWVELDGPVVLNAMVEGLRQLGDNLKNIDLICFDNFSPSMTLMDENGEAIYPIFTHLDRRSKKQTQDILSKFGKERFQTITGIQPFTGGASVTSVLWVKENLPGVFKKIFRLGHLNTFICKKLTGVWYSDPVNASMTGMYETINRTGWSEEICGAFGIPKSLLPCVINPGTIAGSLTKKAAELCGLKEGIPVAMGSNDAACAQVGAGNTTAGKILNISGSSEMVSILIDKPRIDDSYYLRCAATPGLWQIYATTAGGFAIDWFRREFYRDMDEREFFKNEFPRVVENFLDTTAAKFLPYLAGDRQSLTPKKGAFAELTLETKREDLLAAMLIGMHEPIKNVIALCETFMTMDKTIKLTGGMIDAAFLRVKQKLFHDYRFEIIPDCSITGSVRLGMEGLSQGSLV